MSRAAHWLSALVATLLCACEPPQFAPPPGTPLPVATALPPPEVPPALAAIERCGNTDEGFDAWIESFSEHAIGEKEDLAGWLGQAPLVQG